MSIGWIGHELAEEGQIEVNRLEFAPEMLSEGLAVAYIDRSGTLTDLTFCSAALMWDLGEVSAVVQHRPG
jgi:hypothetical protein